MASPGVPSGSQSSHNQQLPNSSNLTKYSKPGSSIKVSAGKPKEDRVYINVQDLTPKSQPAPLPKASLLSQAGDYLRKVGVAIAALLGRTGQFQWKGPKDNLDLEVFSPDITEENVLRPPSEQMTAIPEIVVTEPPASESTAATGLSELPREKEKLEEQMAQVSAKYEKLYSDYQIALSDLEQRHLEKERKIKEKVIDWQNTPENSPYRETKYQEFVYANQFFGNQAIRDAEKKVKRVQTELEKLKQEYKSLDVRLTKVEDGMEKTKFL